MSRHPLPVHGSRTALALWWLTVVLVLTPLAGELILRRLGTFATFGEKDVGQYLSYYGQVRDGWLWTHTPGGSFRYPQAEFDYRVDINREGVRDVDHAIDKPPGVFRVVVLGDSYTEGLGARFDDVWWRVLERQERERGQAVEWISGGVSGNDTFYCYQLLVARLLRYSPDLVLLLLNESDIADYVFRGGMERFRADGTTHFRSGPSWEPAYRASHLLRFFVHRVRGLDWRFHSNADRDALTGQASAALADAVDRFWQLAQDTGFGFLVLTHPTGTELLHHYQGFEPAFLARLSAGPAPHADLGEVLRRRITPQNELQYLWPINQHFNDAGNLLFAEEVERVLQSRGLIPDHRQVMPGAQSPSHPPLPR